MQDSFIFMTPPASAHAGAIDQAQAYVHWLMLALFVGWGTFFIYTLFRFRQSRNPKADYEGVKSKTSTYLEIGVAAIEAILLIGFSIPLWAQRVNDVPPGDEGVHVRVVAQQFAWNVWYAGADGVWGRQDINLVDEETNPLGLDYDDPAAKDDITTINQLHLPVDRPVIIYLSSKDVIHSFGQPHMRVKQDAIPGLSIPTWFVPTVTTAEMRAKTGNDEFLYEVACAQLCGNSHYSMRGFITVETQEEYDAWLEEAQRIRRAFYASCTHIDHQIRNVIGTIREHRMLNDTIICFTSDHGDMLGDHGLWTKQNCFENEVRIPMIIQGPGVERGLIDDRLVSIEDIYPTLLELAGIDVPEHVDGLSMVGNKQRDTVTAVKLADASGCRMIRDKQYKLVYFPAGNQRLLFDLKNDPFLQWR